MKLLLIGLVIISWVNGQFHTKKLKHQPQPQSPETIKYLSSLSDNNHLQTALDRILVPRVVGTRNHSQVFNYIVNELESFGYSVEIDEFVKKAPILGQLKFRNIIATPNPKAERFLVLACHYDSKYFKDMEFVGATDSAVPCALMLNLAKIMSQEVLRSSDLSLMLVFFDGEEAFEEWGPKDSIYGARNLAQKWHRNTTVLNGGERVRFLDRIDVLVLLDLIGAKNPNFYSFFKNTDKWFLRLAEAEQTLGDLGLLENWHGSYFVRQRGYGRIEDDHIPFLQKDVPIVHLIATPFPKEWHTASDNRDIIDMDTVENISKILRVFLAEYLHLSFNNSSNHNGNIHEEL